MVSQLDDFLGERCSLTKTQINRLKVHLTLENNLDVRETEEPGYVISGVSEGAYYRTLDQARNNVMQALFTMLLCSRFGIIKPDELLRLFNLVSKAPAENSETTQEVMSLIQALVKKIVMI